MNAIDSFHQFYQKHAWLSKWLEDPAYVRIRFKMLEKGYPPVDFPPELVTKVPLNMFNRIEAERIPLFIGSQFGVHPRPGNLEGFFNGEKLIAVLVKSLLSGHISGMNLYRIQADDTDFTGNNNRLIRRF